MTDVLPQPGCSPKAGREPLELEESGSERPRNTGARLWGRVRNKLLRNKVPAGAGGSGGAREARGAEGAAGAAGSPARLSRSCPLGGVPGQSGICARRSEWLELDGERLGPPHPDPGAPASAPVSGEGRFLLGRWTLLSRQGAQTGHGETPASGSALFSLNLTPVFSGPCWLPLC